MDYIEGINRFAIPAFLTDIKILAYALMSNHIRLIIKTPDVPKFISSFRISYNKWFNHKYRRSGVYHHLVEYASEYKFSSARYYFMKELGTEHSYNQIEKTSKIRSFITYRGDLPTNIKMDASGMFIPESFLSIQMVEDYYGSLRQFAYHMNKLLTEEWSVTNIETWQKGILPSKIKNKVLHISDHKIYTEVDASLKRKNLIYTELSHPRNSPSPSYILKNMELLAAKWKDVSTILEQPYRVTAGSTNQKIRNLLTLCSLPEAYALLRLNVICRYCQLQS